MISRALWEAVKLSRRRHYWLAAQIGMHPSRFSRLLSGELEVPAGDWRVVKLARLVGIHPNRAFAGRAELRLCPRAPSPDPSDAPDPVSRIPNGTPDSPVLRTVGQQQDRRGSAAQRPTSSPWKRSTRRSMPPRISTSE
jgi:hypothetical protein